MEAGWSAMRVARQLGRSYFVVRRSWDQWIREMSQNALDRPVIQKTAKFDESRFNLSSDDNRVRVWRPRGERFKHAFALQRHTVLTACVMVWVPLPTIHGHP
ncbi:uncharacterized protein TNCV_4169631 [Trichonephila clavipes]|nr:uncharacterized protein TNCV_4169631 [Trichonephila clavipes]